MPPRLNLFTARKAVPIFRQPSLHNSVLNRPQIGLPCLNKRYNSSDSKSGDGKNPKSTTHTGPTQDPLPHVSEEAAAVDMIMHEKKCDGTPTSPELEQGTPVSEVCPSPSYCWA